MLNYYVLTPVQLPATFEHVKEFLPDRFRSIDEFIRLYFQKDTMMFEIGNFAGAFWLANIVPGWRATAHIVVWDETAKKQATRAAGVLRELCRMFRLQKVNAYVPTHLEGAARFVEKIGFVTEGVEKLADYYDGRLVDYLLTAFYPQKET